jgi:kinetochore protein NDC80
VCPDPLLTPAIELPLDHPNLEDRLLWEFSSKSYKEWFDGGAEDFPELERELEEVYGR